MTPEDVRTQLVAALQADLVGPLYESMRARGVMVLLHDPTFARHLERQWMGLIDTGQVLRRVP